MQFQTGALIYLMYLYYINNLYYIKTWIFWRLIFKKLICVSKIKHKSLQWKMFKLLDSVSAASFHLFETVLSHVFIKLTWLITIILFSQQNSPFYKRMAHTVWFCIYIQNHLWKIYRSISIFTRNPLSVQSYFSLPSELFRI